MISLMSFHWEADVNQIQTDMRQQVAATEGKKQKATQGYLVMYFSAGSGVEI